MKRTTRNQKEINPVEFWNELFAPENKSEHDAQLLMFRFLSEVEKFSDINGFSRKELARRIGTSASYLTQVWRGDKPLNFFTLAKMQEALNISFKIIADTNEQEINIEDEGVWHEQIIKYHTHDDGYWCYKRKNDKTSDVDSDFYTNAIDEEPAINKANETKGIAA